MLVILLILVLLFSFVSGAAENKIWPLYGVRKFSIASYKYPEYCGAQRVSTSFLPEYSTEKTRMIKHEIYGPTLMQYIVCMEYLCFYSALRFAGAWTDDIVYVDGFRGVVPYLLAELLDRHVIYVTRKPPIIKHKNVTYVSSFPKKIQNLIYFAVYAPKKLDGWAQAHETTYRKFLDLYKLQPANYLALLQFDDVKNIPLGNLHVPPFSYPSNSPFLLLEGKYTTTFIDVDVSARTKIFNNCLRPNGDYDLWFAHSALRYVKDRSTVWKYLGPLPVAGERITIRFPYEFSYIDSSDLLNSLYFDVCTTKSKKTKSWPITTADDIIYETFFRAACDGTRFVKHQEPDDLKLQSFIRLIYNSDTVNLYRPEKATPCGELLNSYLHPTLLRHGATVMAELNISQFRIWIPDQELVVALFAKAFPDKIICVVGRGHHAAKNVIYKKIPFVEKTDASFL